MSGMDRKRAWVGDRDGFGILQRLGFAGFLISFGLVCLAPNVAGGAPMGYALMVAAHVLLYAGFVLAAAADKAAGRRISFGRLIYTILTALVYAVLGPLFVEAAAMATLAR